MVNSKAGGESFRGSVRVHKKKLETTHLHILCYITFVSNSGETLCRQLDATVDPATNQRRPRDVIRRLLNMTSCHLIRDNCHQATRIRNVLTQKLWREIQGYGVL